MSSFSSAAAEDYGPQLELVHQALDEYVVMN